MQKYLLLLFLIASTAIVLSAQTRISFEHAMKFDPNRYAEYQGSPYLFPEFTSGWIIGMDGFKYDEVRVNYNGLTESVEVLEGDYYINLKEPLYLMVKMLDPETQDTLKFIRGIHRRFQGKYLQLLYQSSNSIFVNQFQAELLESPSSTVGSTEGKKRIKKTNNYFVKWIEKDEPILLKNKKKSWIRSFGNRKKIEAYLKENKLDLSDPNDMIQLLKHIE